MGGHHSVQVADQTVKTISNVVQNTTQQCVSTSDGLLYIGVSGSDNTISGDTQRVTFSVDSKCVGDLFNHGNLDSKIQSGVGQALKDQEIALSQWMDAAKDTNYTNINNTVEENVTQTTVQNCINGLNAREIQSYSGNRNIASNILQEDSASMIGGCMLQNNQASKAISDITNTINQSSDYTSKNPLAFLTDALTEIFGSVMKVAAVILILIICFIGVFLLHNGKEIVPVMAGAMRAHTQPENKQKEMKASEKK